MSVADAKNVKKRRDPKTGDVYELVDGRWGKIDEKADPAAKVSPDNMAAAGAGKGDRHLLPERPSGCCAQKVPVPLFPPKI